MGDTSYGACCIDEVNAQHIQADLIVHFAHSCLSRTTALTPVLYVFCRYPLAHAEVLTSLKSLAASAPSTLHVYYDCVFAHVLDQESLDGVSFMEIPSYFKKAPDTEGVSLSPVTLKEGRIVYIGEENDEFRGL